MTKKGAEEFKGFDTVRNYRLRALYGIDQLRNYARRKVKEMKQEEETEETYEELYIEALRDKTVRKVMANYREQRTEEEKTKATICSIITMIETIILVLFIS